MTIRLVRCGGAVLGSPCAAAAAHRGTPRRSQQARHSSGWQLKILTHVAHPLPLPPALCPPHARPTPRRTCSHVCVPGCHDRPDQLHLYVMLYGSTYLQAVVRQHVTDRN